MAREAELPDLVQWLSDGRLTRREFIVRAAALGVSASAIGAFLAACGGSSATPTAGATAAAGATKAPSPAASAAAGSATTGGATTTAPTTAASSGTPVNGGEITFATTTEGITLHPFKFTDTPSEAYIDLMHWIPLMRYDKDTLELKPFAAASVQESADHTILTFTLRDNLLWSDGQPLTATDYAWTWAQAVDPANKWPRAGSYTPYIDKVTDLDAKTLEVRLKNPLGISKHKVASDFAALSYVLPKHIWEKLDWNDPNKNPEILKPTVVAGPYKLQEWKKDQYGTFAANDKFFLGRPHIDKVTRRVYGDANVATQALANGEVDYYGPEPENWPDLQKNAKLNTFAYESVDGLGVTYIGFNTRLDALKDKNVRQALNYALDKDAIVSKLTYGLGRRATGMYIPTSWAYEPNVNPYKYDPNKAKQLLDEAGWKPGASGIREKNGQPLKMLFLFGPVNTPVREQIATVAQQQWKAVGADVEVRGLEYGALLKQTNEGPYDWACFVNAYLTGVDPDTLWWKKDAGPSYNRADYHNPRVEDLYEQALREFDRDKRKTMYQEIQRILTDESPWIWIYYELGHAAINKRVQGVRVTKSYGLNDLWEWWIQG
jgi:peptide/nickel transport system substrate-binding protein